MRGMRGFALVRVLIGLAILGVLAILANQVYSGSKTPLRTIQIGSDIVITCKAPESVMFTGFSLDEREQPTPFMRGYLGPTGGTAKLDDDPPAGAPLRLRFAINTDDSAMEVQGLSVPANKWLGVLGPLPKTAEEIPDDDEMLEYIHSSGKVELHVDVKAGRLVIEYRRPA